MPAWNRLNTLSFAHSIKSTTINLRSNKIFFVPINRFMHFGDYLILFLCIQHKFCRYLLQYHIQCGYNRVFLKRLCVFALSVRYSCCFHGYDKEEMKTLACFFILMKYECHIERIINCTICLYVGRGIFCNGSKMPKNSFFISG